jgi:hypothetical protein
MGINILGILSGILVIIGLVLIYVLTRKTPQNLPASSAGDAFAKEVKAVLQDVYPNTAFIYDEANDTYAPISMNEDDEAPFLNIFLGNLRNRTLELGQADRDAYIRNFLNQVTQSEEVTAATLREKLCMRNRTPEEFSLRLLSMTPDAGEDPFEPIIIAKGEMLFEPVLNLENAVSSVNVKTMREHGFAFDELIQIAGQNLLDFTPNTATDHWEKLEGNIWISKLNDDFDAARVFLFPEQLKFPFTGSLVVFAPSHTICLITSHTDEATLARMIELGKASAETHRPLSHALWHQTDDGWRRMESEDRNSTVGRARLIETLTAYEDQKNSLEQHFEKTKQDIHVAAVIARSDDTDPEAPKIETRAVFIGAGSYLPKTDFIILGFETMSDSKPIDQVTWDTLVEVLGDSFQPHPDFLPARYIYSGELTKSEIQALRAAATEL